MRLHLTDKGSAQLAALSEQHLEELAHLAPTMHALWDALEHADGPPTPPRARASDYRLWSSIGSR